MKQRRIKAEKGLDGVYHCMSRVVGSENLLDEVCKEKMVQLLYKLAAFNDVQVLTYCIMPNHFHVLVRVPPRRDPESVTDAELFERMQQFYGKKAALTELVRTHLEKGEPIPRAIRDSILSRSREVSQFMREFKQRFARWYNSLKERSGYLWAARFKSVLVEDSPNTIRPMSAYIDLNPIRAGLVEDPKDYPYSCFAAAMAGDKNARQSLMNCIGEDSWNRAVGEYRSLLYLGGKKGADEKALDPAAIQAELQRGTELPVAQSLRLRRRHMTDGVIFGSKEFVEDVWKKNKESFGARRKSGARPIRGAPLPGISVLRDLQVKAVG